jgi:GNAT superfamily N-acetyltransferase
MRLRVLSAPYSQLPAEQRSRLEEIADAAFGHIPLVMQTQWAEPDVAYLGYLGDEFAVFHNVILRSVDIDGTRVRVAGLNNMITLEAYRGRGLASALLRQTQPSWFEELDVEIGMLLCADALVPFYERLEWRRVQVPVIYQQSDGAHVWPANCMVLDAGRGVVPSVRVDLRGLPW